MYLYCFFTIISLNALEQNKKNAQQNASITLDKLKKYLPTHVRAQGLGGLGVSESTMLQAYNNYNNQMGQITGDYNRNKTSLEEAYGSKKSDLDLAANEAVNNIAKNYSNKFESEQKEAQDLLYNEFVSKVQSGSFNTTSELEALYEGIKGKLSEEQRIVIEGELNTLKNNPSQQTIDKNYEDNVNNVTRILEGKEYISYGGSNYQIKSQLNGDSNEIKRNNDFKKQLQDNFGTTNPFDSKIPNGTTFTIKADNRGSNDFNFWDDIGAFLLSPLGYGAWDSWGNWNTVYVTYYNGNWYKSEKK